MKVRETEQKGERDECVPGGGGWGGGLGADQGHCAFHKPRSAIQTPSPLCFSHIEEHVVARLVSLQNFSLAR